MQETFVGSTKLVTDMHVNYLTPEKLYLFTNLELPKICVIFTACLKILNTEIYNEDRSDEMVDFILQCKCNIHTNLHSSH